MTWVACEKLGMPVLTNAWMGSAITKDMSGRTGKEGEEKQEGVIGMEEWKQ